MLRAVSEYRNLNTPWQLSTWHVPESDTASASTWHGRSSECKCYMTATM